jgi:hypothetical protein
VLDGDREEGGGRGGTDRVPWVHGVVGGGF